MSIQWTLIAGFLYVEIAIVMLLVLPLISPKRWKRIFQSKILKALESQAKIYFLVLLVILVLFLLDAIREMRKYSTENTEHQHNHLDAEMQGNMRLFRAQRNFYISGFALFLSFVIQRLVSLISAQASLLAENEATMKQAKSASSVAQSYIQKSGEKSQNDTNEAHKTVTELKAQLKKLEAEKLEVEIELKKQIKDKEAMKSQSENLAKEFARLSDDYMKLQNSSTDKKKD